MPEGHLIHRIARDHNRRLRGESLRVCSPQGRFSAAAEQLDGQMLTQVEAHGKHLFYHWESAAMVHVHLGLYGKFRLKKTPLPEPRGEIRLRVAGEKFGFDLHGPNQCELIDSADYATLRARLGADPLRSDADPEQAWQKLQRSKTAIGTLLLNQSVFAGIGNIYRAEALFVLGIHPERPGRSLTRDEFYRLWGLISEWFLLGVKYNRIITTYQSGSDRPAGRLTKSERLHIYKRERCPNCGANIRRWLQASRAMYACEQCQS